MMLARRIRQIKDFPKFLRLGWSDKLLLVEALLHLAAARLVLGVIPFWHIASRLGQAFPSGTGAPPDDSIAPGAARVGWAVENMARRTLWDNNCLVRAIAAKFMLRRRRVPNRLYLGRTQDESGKVIPHSWLRVGPVTLVGASWRDTHKFIVLAVYADPPAAGKGDA
jgi:hypothetical protein